MSQLPAGSPLGTRLVWQNSSCGGRNFEDWLLGSTWFCSILLHCTMALLSSTWPHLTLLHSTWLYLALVTLLDSITLKITLCQGSTWLYFTLLDSTILCHDSTWLYSILLNSIMLHHGSTWVYLNLYTLSRLYLALLDSTTLYILHSTTRRVL